MRVLTTEVPVSRPSEDATPRPSVSAILIAAAFAPAALCLLLASIIHSPGSAGVLCAVGCVPACAVTLWFYRHLRVARDGHESAVNTMTARSSMVDRLLEFSQTIQAAGKPEQIFDALAYPFAPNLN